MGRSFAVLLLLSRLIGSGAAQDINSKIPTTSVTDPVQFTEAAPDTRGAEQQHVPNNVNWARLVRDSLLFLSVEHAFRCATEGGTRAAFGNSFIRGYSRSVGNLHGWADGDPFYVNYVGHPMQGAVASFIWSNNDRGYQSFGLGSDSRYWKSKLRGMAFAYVHSVQFEIGLFSEASIGNIQAKFPQQGLVDHVVTPTVGIGWAIAEDALDRYIVEPLETRTHNPWARLLIRGGLNPSRSMANVMSGKVPWHRNNRPGVLSYSTASYAPMQRDSVRSPVRVGVDRFDFEIRSTLRRYVGKYSRSCVGGEGVAAVRIGEQWQVVLDVGGCKLLGLKHELSGDSLDYLGGMRWSPTTSSRWVPRVALLIGGMKITKEQMFPDLKSSLPSYAKENSLESPHGLYTAHVETNGLAIRTELSVDVKLNNALVLHLAGIEYSHSWTNQLSGDIYQNSVQLSSGVTLRIGSW